MDFLKTIHYQRTKGPRFCDLTSTDWIKSVMDLQTPKEDMIYSHLHLGFMFIVESSYR